MKHVGWVGLLVAFSISGIAFAADEATKTTTTVTTTTTTKTPGNQYVGSGKCKTCHSSVAKGAQYKQWADSKHANAFAVLASPRALEIAKAKGIENPQKAPECLECHVTGFGAPKEHFAATFLESEGIGCESCHGAGAGYVKLGAKKKTAGAASGLLPVTKETCAKCHNERGTSGKFVDWPADSVKIAHPVPAK